MVGRIDKDGTVHPYDLKFYFKTGVKDSQDSNNFKDKRKNAKDNDINKLCSYKNDEDKKLCSQAKDNTAGSSRDQNDAAVITPAANPCIIARNLSSILLTKNTRAAPRAVQAQVKIPAISACKIGFIHKNHSYIINSFCF